VVVLDTKLPLLDHLVNFVEGSRDNDPNGGSSGLGGVVAFDPDKQPFELTEKAEKQVAV
jgi:hypothetical protein